MAQHARWKAAGASNNTMLIVECDGRLDAARVTTALDRLVDLCPWPSARLRRPWPWGKLRWVAGARDTLTPPAVRHRVAHTREALHAIFEGELNAAIDGARETPLRFTVIDDDSVAPTRGVLVATWFHPLMDPRGAQNLLRHLARLDAANGAAMLDDMPLPFVAPATPRAPLRERGRVARRSLAYMQTLAPVPPVSPGSRLTTAAPARFRRQSFVAGTGDRRTREITWRLAIVGKAMAELWRRRGLPDVPFLLPIAVDLRPKGEAGPTFGNRLAFHFARFRLDDTRDVPALARALRQQMADALRDGQIDANAVAMEFLHYRPLSTMLRALPWTASGELFSFNCADVGDVPCALAELFGRRVTNAYHVPCVLPRPGVGVFFNRCGDVENVVVSWVDGALSADDAARIVDVVGEEMAWTATR